MRNCKGCSFDNYDSECMLREIVMTIGKCWVAEGPLHIWDEQNL